MQWWPQENQERLHKICCNEISLTLHSNHNSRNCSLQNWALDAAKHHIQTPLSTWAAPPNRTPSAAPFHFYLPPPAQKSPFTDRTQPAQKRLAFPPQSGRNETSAAGSAGLGVLVLTRGCCSVPPRQHYVLCVNVTM